MAIHIDKHFGTRECPSCGVEVEANHNRCPVCGYEFPAAHPARRAVIWIVAVVLLIAFLSARLVRFL
ncbi:MAG TPA: hypothetical protein PKE26_08355 [Kiritimatiellia bacterium]|nr:hypothetical protein [Kiritimatiellia bacterium]HMO99105.1 hypothetical protein [Kiritimatiellia bacterium]HMP96939.1 hypothetical protein [Kiritimatiellia bacterium]